MNTLNRKRIFGFTIIELMIVLIIVAILVGLAYPSYLDYVRKSKRGEAQQLLLNWSINQEIWRSNNTTYDDGTGIAEPCSQPDSDCDYEFAASLVTGTTYTLTASALDGNDQQNDKAKDGTDCSSLTVNQSGVKSPPACWD